MFFVLVLVRRRPFSIFKRMLIKFFSIRLPPCVCAGSDTFAWPDVLGRDRGRIAIAGGHVAQTIEMRHHVDTFQTLPILTESTMKSMANMGFPAKSPISCSFLMFRDRVI